MASAVSVPPCGEPDGMIKTREDLEVTLGIEAAKFRRNFTGEK